MTDDDAVTAPDGDDLPDQIRTFVRRQVALAELPAAAIVAETSCRS
ncbi:hypothetical protein [Micromonospora sp. NPDC050495]